MNLINYVLFFITIPKLEPDFGQLEFTDFTEKHIVFDRHRFKFVLVFKLQTLIPSRQRISNMFDTLSRFQNYCFYLSCVSVMRCSV